MSIRHIAVNLPITTLLMFALWYSGPALEGIWFNVKVIPRAPSFIIVALVAGMNNAMHFTPEIVFKVVSFIIYSTVIAFVQICIYKRNKNRR